jgi:hypothetical protein
MGKIINRAHQRGKKKSQKVVVRWRASKGRNEPPSAYRPPGFTIATVTPDNPAVSRRCRIQSLRCSAPRRASTSAPKLGMTWATATRPGELLLAGHVVKAGRVQRNAPVWYYTKLRPSKRLCGEKLMSRRRCKISSAVVTRTVHAVVRWDAAPTPVMRSLFNLCRFIRLSQF